MESVRRFILFVLSGFMLVGCLWEGGGSSSSSNNISAGDTIIQFGSVDQGVFNQGVALAEHTSLDAGGSTPISVNIVDGDGNPSTSQHTVEFSSVCVLNGLAILDSESVQTTNGSAETTYTARGCSGEDQVVASVNVDSVELKASVMLTVAADDPLSLQFVSASETQLALPGIGGQETATITFKLVGTHGTPLPGETISFTTSAAAGGFSILPGAETRVTDNQGLVSTTVKSGITALTAHVIATHDATGRQGNSEGITVSTGVAVFDKFSIGAEDLTPDKSLDWNGIEDRIAIIASDQFGNSVPRGGQVRFISPESGQIESYCTIEGPGCSVTWVSSSPRPVDRRVTILAFTSGAETYTDDNGNGVYDSGEPFIDLPEAFADENENGFHDIGEYYFDANDNGVYDYGNGFWDGPCLTSVNPAANCQGEDSTTLFKQIVLELQPDPDLEDGE